MRAALARNSDEAPEPRLTSYCRHDACRVGLSLVTIPEWSSRPGNRVTRSTAVNIDHRANAEGPSAARILFVSAVNSVCLSGASSMRLFISD